MTWIEAVLKKKHVTVKNSRANIPNVRIKQTFEECANSRKIERLCEYAKEIIEKHRKETSSIEFCLKNNNLLLLR